MFLTYAIAIGLAATPRVGSAARVSGMHLADLVRFSDVIVIGSVEQIETVPAKPRRMEFERLPGEVPVAAVRVSRVLKGPPSLAWANYVATPTWTCDITTAELGESALFFFGDASRDELVDEDLRREIGEVLPNGELWDLMHSGRGRMPLAEGLFTYWTDVGMPTDCPDVDGPEPEYTRLIRSVSEAWLSDRIEQITAEQRGKPWFRASVQDAGRGGCSWELDVSMDRAARLLVHEPGGDRERRFVADWHPALGLSGCDDAMKSTVSRTIGTDHDPLGDRQFEIVGDVEPSGVRILSIDSKWMSDPTRAVSTQRWLWLWRDLRDVIDDSACADHRKSDEEWIETSRSPPLFGSPMSVSLVVIGGAILGLAIAHGIRRRHPSRRVAVLDGDPR